MKENLSEVLIEKIKFESLKNELEIILLNKKNDETNINLKSGFKFYEVKIKSVEL